MMDKKNALRCLFIVLSLSFHAFAVEASDFPRYPVRNGDFSIYQGWGRPAEWNPAQQSGKLQFKLDVASLESVNPPSPALIETLETGRGCFFQTVPLMKGNYRFSVEIWGTTGARAQITVGTAATDLLAAKEKWKEVQMDFAAGTEGTTIYLYSDSPAGSKVKFRQVKVETKTLESAAIPFEDGTTLGGVVLPADPSSAEKYAAYELQRYIFNITGRVPGLKGRDKVYEGRFIGIGNVAPAKILDKLKGRAEDSYLVAKEGNNIVLAGNTPTGTLYAVYDFLTQQGCRWIIPGPIGEVVPARKALATGKDKLEIPDYLTRGFFAWAQDFFPGGGTERGWIYVNMDDYFDWAVRNRMNAIWNGGGTYDFGADRGHGWIQNSGHSFNSLIAPHEQYFKSHPDWYPLVRGKRMPVADVGPKLPNQLCVSNPSLREYTVNLTLDYFKRNPTSKIFPMNPMDGPNYWCECAACKKLDPAGIDWSQNAKANLPVADRLINYANFVADRVAKVYPDKLIEVYAYNPRVPPVKEKVHPNILIKFAFCSGRPVTVGLLDPNDSYAKLERKYLDGWKAAGMRNLSYYNYADWEHPDAALFWFSNITDTLKNLNVHYGCRGLLGETETQIQADPMWYAVMARTLWNVRTDYREVIRDACETFYGPVGKEVYAVNLLMDETVRTGKASTEQNQHLELSYEALVRSRTMLDAAAARVKTDPVLSRRVALARCALANLLYVRAQYEPRKTAKWANLARDGFETANALRSQYNIMVKLPTAQLLKDFYYPAIVEENSSPVLKLPLSWRFKTDSSDMGEKQQWFRGDLDVSWATIRTDQAWTQQGYETYHGVAWYRIDFTLPSDYKQGTPLMLYFGAVDGYTDVFLNGEKIGEQKKDVGLMWDKPFTVPLPTALSAGTLHHLAVRVRKEHSAAGIWKPVTILRSSDR